MADSPWNRLRLRLRLSGFSLNHFLHFTCSEIKQVEIKVKVE